MFSWERAAKTSLYLKKTHGRVIFGWCAARRAAAVPSCKSLRMKHTPQLIILNIPLAFMLYRENNDG
jgi:hypothetical protein